MNYNDSTGNYIPSDFDRDMYTCPLHGADHNHYDRYDVKQNEDGNYYCLSCFSEGKFQVLQHVKITKKTVKCRIDYTINSIDGKFDQVILPYMGNNEVFTYEISVPIIHEEIIK